MVGQVEELRAEVDVVIFGDPEALEERQVHVEYARSAFGRDRGVPECSEGRTLVSAGPVIGTDRTLDRRGGSPKPLLNGAVLHDQRTEIVGPLRTAGRLLALANCGQS